MSEVSCPFSDDFACKAGREFCPSMQARMCIDDREGRPTDETPWPNVQECYWPAPGLVEQRHSCAQCDGSHDHAWVSGPASPHGGGVPVRCRICGGRKCDMPACRLRRHHSEDHEEF